jgi:hypothetical protein
MRQETADALAISPKSAIISAKRPLPRPPRPSRGGLVRRFLIIFLILTIAGCVLLVAARMRRQGAGDAFRYEEPDAAGTEVAGSEQEVAAEVDVVVSLASRDEPPPEPREAPHDAERVLSELAQLRAEVVERVDRRPLFAMAQARGLPNHVLFTMSSQQLLDAIMDAEGLPPEDVLPSPESADQVRSVVAEAFRRHEEFTAEESSERDAG